MPAIMGEMGFKAHAIHPHSGEIEDAVLFKNYFGPHKHAIVFKGLNQPRWNADLIAYEVLSEKRI